MPKSTLTMCAVGGAVPKTVNGSGDKTSQIAKVIEEIAFHTNILALNAAIAAAGAGEAGCQERTCALEQTAACSVLAAKARAFQAIAERLSGVVEGASAEVSSAGGARAAPAPRAMSNTSDLAVLQNALRKSRPRKRGRFSASPPVDERQNAF
jgi:hypothetical protein